MQRLIDILGFRQGPPLQAALPGPLRPSEIDEVQLGAPHDVGRLTGRQEIPLFELDGKYAMRSGRSLVGWGGRHCPVCIPQEQHVQSLRLRPCLMHTQILEVQIPLQVLANNDLGPLLDRGGALLAEQVIPAFVVHLHAGQENGVALGIPSPFLILKQLGEAPWNDSSRGIGGPTNHGVRLPTPSLSVAEYASIVPLQEPTEHPVGRRLEDPLLGILGVEDLLEREI
mmetsp:Transcript_59728/g.159840  ORF Transcript_59728/g.159840 Transcript_59728/m.159840 type:complete len:227 (-) Transcript_59728:226-906(-)